MTAAIRPSAYPKSVDELLPEAVALVKRLGDLPTRNRLMTTLKIGAPKATELLERLADAEANGALGILVPSGPPEPDADPDGPGSDEPDEDRPARLHLVPDSPMAEPDAPDPDEPNEPVRADVDPGPAVPTPAPAEPASIPAAGRRRGPSGRIVSYLGAALGGFGSIAANVAHSFVQPRPDGWVPVKDWSPEPGAVIGAMFWPIAVLVAVEILARVDWPAGRRWVALRFGGLLPVALVAAFVSYRHLSGLLDHWGEDDLTVAFGPLAVDGLMVVATAALLAIGRTRKTATKEN